MNIFSLVLGLDMFVQATDPLADLIRFKNFQREHGEVHVRIIGGYPVAATLAMLERWEEAVPPEELSQLFEARERFEQLKKAAPDVASEELRKARKARKAKQNESKARGDSAPPRAA